MDFGRTEDFAEREMRLGPDHAGVSKVLGGQRAANPGAFVGGVLWADESFKGSVYPRSAKPKDYVKYYARQFNTIELNLTHYRTPEPESVKRWYDLSPEGFRFCPKVHQDISHAGNLLSVVKQHNEDGQLFGNLRSKLGVQFMQLPPHFAPVRLNELLEFLDQSNQRNFAIEIRHPEWFAGGPALNTLCNYLYKNNITLLITDTPARRDVLHMRLTCKTAVIRFNANDQHPTDFARMDEWIARLETWFNNGLETLYFFVHTPQQVNMPALVTYFIKQLNKTCGLKLKTPVIQKEEEENSLFG